MSDFNQSGMAWLALAWLAYFALHSTLASLHAKRRVAAAFPRVMPFYRLIFNAQAVILLVPLLWLTYRNPGALLWRWHGPFFWLANGLALAALGGFWHTLSSYDTQEFLGLRQWRGHVERVEDQEHFHLSWYHRFVRHPWYFFGLVMLWTRDMYVLSLLSSAMITLYFVIGSRLEEGKLLVYHGETYRLYMARVPGLIPLPWKFLSTEEKDPLSQEHPSDRLPNSEK
jgi:methanethiol S-methyltransferase